MNKNRMEAFSDGVIAIIITIMVLELKVQHGSNLKDLKPLMPVFISYLLSFIYVGIYWNNHHHMMQAVRQVNGQILWANLHLLFWMSLVPFVTDWMGENHFDEWPVALYGFILFMSAVAFTILSKTLRKLEGKDSTLSKAVGDGKKENASLVFYVIAISVAFVDSAISLILYAAVACIWFIPDKRVEKRINNTDDNAH